MSFERARAAVCAGRVGFGCCVSMISDCRCCCVYRRPSIHVLGF